MWFREENEWEYPELQTFRFIQKSRFWILALRLGHVVDSELWRVHLVKIAVNTVWLSGLE